MDLSLEKQEIKASLDEVNDAHLLKAIKEMLLSHKSKLEERYLQPFTKQQLVKRALQSEEDIKNGRLTGLAKLRKEVKNW